MERSGRGFPRPHCSESTYISHPLTVLRCSLDGRVQSADAAPSTGPQLPAPTRPAGTRSPGKNWCLRPPSCRGKKLRGTLIAPQGVRSGHGDRERCLCFVILHLSQPPLLLRETAAPQIISPQVLASGLAFGGPKPEQTANMKRALDAGRFGQDADTAGDTYGPSWSVPVKASGLFYRVRRSQFRRPRKYFLPSIRYIYAPLNLEKSKG